MVHQFTALVGNGLSVPYAPALAVSELTRGLIEELEELSGTEAGDALAALAQHVRGLAPASSRSNFERLLGPLEATAAAIAQLSRIADLTENASSIKDASTTLTTFSAAVHRLGLATVLRHIALKSEATLDDPQFVGTVRSFVHALQSLPTDTPRTIGTVNYDGLVHCAALDLEVSLADLSTGYSFAEHCVVTGHPLLPAHRLRSEGNLPGRDIEVLNLHGALGWLRADDGTTWKFELAALRDQGYWDALAAGETAWQPVVILTDQKTRAVAEPPFSLAYDILRSRLARSDRWMIVGYGFGDEPVNAVLQSAAEVMDKESRDGLKILVVDCGGDADEIGKNVARKVRIPSEQVTVDTAGIPDAIEAQLWSEWSGE